MDGMDAAGNGRSDGRGDARWFEEFVGALGDALPPGSVGPVALNELAKDLVISVEAASEKMLGALAEAHRSGDGSGIEAGLSEEASKIVEEELSPMLGGKQFDPSKAEGVIASVIRQAAARHLVERWGLAGSAHAASLLSSGVADGGELRARASEIVAGAGFADAEREQWGARLEALASFMEFGSKAAPLLVEEMAKVCSAWVAEASAAAEERSREQPKQSPEANPAGFSKEYGERLGLAVRMEEVFERSEGRPPTEQERSMLRKVGSMFHSAGTTKLIARRSDVVGAEELAAEMKTLALDLSKRELAKLSPKQETLAEMLEIAAMAAKKSFAQRSVQQVAAAGFAGTAASRAAEPQERKKFEKSLAGPVAGVAGKAVPARSSTFSRVAANPGSWGIGMVVGSAVGYGFVAGSVMAGSSAALAGAAVAAMAVGVPVMAAAAVLMGLARESARRAGIRKGREDAVGKPVKDERPLWRRALAHPTGWGIGAVAGLGMSVGAAGTVGLAVAGTLAGLPLAVATAALAGLGLEQARRDGVKRGKFEAQVEGLGRYGSARGPKP